MKRRYKGTWRVKNVERENEIGRYIERKKEIQRDIENETEIQRDA